MSSIGPLGLPPSAPIVNPVLWAPELPSNRPSPQQPLPHVVHAQPMSVPHAHMGGSAVVDTPVDIEKRAEFAHDTTFHQTPDLQEARQEGYNPDLALGPIRTDGEVGVGTNPEGEPATAFTGAEADPYGICTTGTAAAPASGGDQLGDGSVADAMRAIEAVRGGDAAGGERAAKGQA